jgi:hypothetical protein
MSQQVGRIADAAHGHLPEYALELSDADMAIFRLRREINVAEMLV